MRGHGRESVENVEAYLARLPEDQRAALRNLRATVRRAAPDAEEVISYGMPVFRQDGVLVYYAAFRDHCSFFPASGATLRKFAGELKPFVAGKGTLHFTPEHPLPATLVTRIVKARIAENAARAERRRNARASKRPR